LEVGGSGNVLEWNRVQPEVAKTTRVCSYDRAGFGWSELGPNPRSAVEIVSELHSLLQAAHVSGPYVLAGHSIGGLFVRLYATTYSADVAGLVLVDATHEDLQRRMPPEAGASGGNPFLFHLVLNLHEFMVVSGYTRLSGVRLVVNGRALTPEARTLAEGIKVRTTMPFADAGESLVLEESMTQVRQTRRVLDVPLVVVTRGRYDGLQRLPKETQARIKNAWEDMQADLVTLSSQGTQMVAANSDHYVHLGQPDIVVDAIRKVVAKTRLSATAKAEASQSSIEVDWRTAARPQ
jgi:pimeloyl-ACP methyl ester carboxylesterase